LHLSSKQMTTLHLNSKQMTTQHLNSKQMTTLPLNSKQNVYCAFELQTIPFWKQYVFHVHVYVSILST
jgi:hypothetical protein